ncbi:MAG: ComEC family competence protein [Planctomycetes bacterium]|nr:ComEC family competence protein [Planctomycetota bacterium]
MSESLLESFYLDELGREEVKRPHPPAPLFPLALGLVVGIAADAAWAWGTGVYITVFVVAGASVLACTLAEEFRGARDSAGGTRRSVSASARAADKSDSIRPRLVALPSSLLNNMLLATCAAAAGGLLHDAHFRHLPDDHVARYVGEEPFDATVIGQIVTSPRLVKPAPMSISGVLDRPPRTKFIVALEHAEGEDGPVELRGLVDVTVREPVFDLYCGDRVRIFGRLYKPSAPRNPGQFDWALAKRRQGIHAGLTCKYPEAITKEARPGPAWRRALDRLRLEATTLLLDDVLEDKLGERSLLNAMVLGQRSQLDRDIYAAFERTGTSHFLALSGMHVGMLGLFGWGLGRLAGLSKRLTALLVLATLIVYALVVEPRPSVLRATVIGTMICLGYIFRKPTNMLNSISLAALILLIWEPLQLFQAGFQLSFVATLGIIYLTPVLPRLAGIRSMSPKNTHAADAMGRKVGVITSKGQHRVSSWLSRAWQSMGRYFLYTLWLSLAAWFAISPLGAFHFNRIFTYVWLFTPLLMPLVLVTMALLLPALGGSCHRGINSIAMPARLGLERRRRSPRGSGGSLRHARIGRL